jgi:hypothetical protein
MTGIVGYDIQYSYDFVVLLLCGAVGVAKKRCGHYTGSVVVSVTALASG